jgi:hypothetical protein
MLHSKIKTIKEFRVLRENHDAVLCIFPKDFYFT